MTPCRYSSGEISALSCYKAGCHQPTCRAANTRYSRRWAHTTNNGTDLLLIDPALVVAHLTHLAQAGMTIDAIAAASGVAKKTIEQVLATRNGGGRSASMQRITASALLSVKPQLCPTAMINPLGSRRRLHALIAAGWAPRALSEISGINPSTLDVLMHRGKLVSGRHAKTVRDLYDELWDTPPPAGTVLERRRIALALTVARKHGYVQAMAWDDDEIDDPAARPRSGRTRDDRKVIVDEVAVERLKRGQAVPVNKLEQRTAIAELTAARVPTAEIANRLDMSLSSAIRTRNRITAAERQTA